MTIPPRSTSCRLVVFDWAGTLVDFGCCAPLAAFLEGFAAAGLPISEEVARQPMGAHKRDHVREILSQPEIAARARADLGREPDESLVNDIFARFNDRLPQVLPLHSAPIPGALETLAWLRDQQVPVGSTTGYIRSMMNHLEPAARTAGLDPGPVICADEVPQSRPAPWACLRLAEQFRAYPIAQCVKVGDTPADIAEGRHAGMITLGVVDTGNEVGLGLDAFMALTPAERDRRRSEARARLLQAGATDVLSGVQELPAWLARNLS